jgi:hypothetical protein
MKKQLIIILFILSASVAFSQEIENIGGKYYKKGMLYSGVHTEYYTNHTPKTILNISNGVLEGTVTTFFPNGTKQELRSFKNGNKDGVWITWNETGRKTAQAEYKNNLKHGDCLSGRQMENLCMNCITIWGLKPEHGRFMMKPGN